MQADKENLRPSALSAKPQKREYVRIVKTQTYLGLIASVIQQSPTRRLTFLQIMKNLNGFVSGQKKKLENCVRVTLTSNKCFVKVPVNPENPKGKKSFWEFDETRITPVLFRRHFKGLEGTFTHLAQRMSRGAKENSPSSATPSAAKQPNTKFTGSFSIESILNEKRSSQSIERWSPLPGSLEVVRGGAAGNIDRDEQVFGFSETVVNFRGRTPMETEPSDPFSTSGQERHGIDCMYARSGFTLLQDDPYEWICSSTYLPSHTFPPTLTINMMRPGTALDFSNQLSYPLGLYSSETQWGPQHVWVDREYDGLTFASRLTHES
ncbi:forkhead box protein H1 [Lepisosteus oculatus]|uniref:forkhead box protein H1 n=1 Tax=Lepisosteus oculatus TaxID=7918 RepID=UPI0035F52998